MKQQNKKPLARTGAERGSTLLLVTLSLVAIIGVMGLAIDGGQMYATKQGAQAAADAAALAGVMDMYQHGADPTKGTNLGPGSYGSHYTCGAADTYTPCYYSKKNGFDPAADTVKVDFSGSVAAGDSCAAPGVTLSGDTPDFICATISRVVNTTFLRVLNVNSSTVIAHAVAAIALVPSPVPIVVTHPTMAGSLQNGGSSLITITGGPQRSIQVNSDNANAAQIGHVDLSGAGPTGQGGDFGTFGGPSTKPGNLNLGLNGHYIYPASPIEDPLALVPTPPIPTVINPAKTALANGVNGCPASPKKSCNLYHPGYYTSDINVKNETGVFSPGIYYMYGANFSQAANGDIVMATGITDVGANSTGTSWTGNMLVYLTGPVSGTTAATGNITVGANSSASMVGSPNGSVYEGILFFVNRSAAAQTHSFGGGGTTSVIGTIYATDTLAIMQAHSAQYQSISFGGGSGNGTNITGEIIAGAISLGGNSSITMTLSPVAVSNVREVALVQ